MSLAIDFGTSNTVVARWNPVSQTPETLKLPNLSTLTLQNPPLIPSLVYVEDAQTPRLIAGQQVRDRGLDLGQDSRFFQGFKRGIGANIPGFRPELDGVTVEFNQVGDWFLQQVIAGIQAVPLPLDSLVLTVPVDSFEPYRHWLAQVFRNQTSVQELRLVDEPTAAALGYGVGDRDLLLVVDFGGGTLDLALVRLEKHKSRTPLGFLLKWGGQDFGEKSGQRSSLARVLAKAGKNLGGADVDNWILDYWRESHPLPVTPLLLRLAERIKIQLSQQPEARDAYFDEDSFTSYDLSLNRSQLQHILEQRGFFQQLDMVMTQVLRQAQQQGIDPRDIQGALLVGGSTQLPVIQPWLEQYFSQDKILSQRPFEAIAHGALQVTQGMEIQDFLYHSYGLRYWNSRTQCQDWHPLIQAGQAYPLSQPVELVLGASTEQQPTLELVLGEIGSEGLNTEVFFDGDRLVTRTLQPKQRPVTPLNDSPEGRRLAPLNPPGSPGVDRLKVLFTVDAQRQLRVTIEDLLTLETLVDDRAIVTLS